LDRVVAKGGEGLILHQASAPHLSGRSDYLMKLKPHQDMEAVVVDHIPGTGRLSGKMGALMVQLESGLKFKIGTGFTDEQRTNPPRIGEVITFRYQGLTKRGVPRFASFLRIRNDGYPFEVSSE
jgi:DNA ligase-1